MGALTSTLLAIVQSESCVLTKGHIPYMTHTIDILMYLIIFSKKSVR